MGACMADLEQGKPSETQSSKERSKLNRRRFFQVSGALAVAGAVVGERVASGRLDPRELAPPLSDTDLERARAAFFAAGSKPVLPPLEVIALNRMGFGPRAGDLEAFRKLPGGDTNAKFRAYVEQQLEPEKIDDAECNARLAGYPALGKPLEQAWQDYKANIPESDDKRYEKYYQPVLETRLAMITRAVYSKRQLLEVMVDFWHNHFNSTPDRDGDRIAPIWASYDALMRKHALGNFRNLLEGVAMHPAMLVYLDNISSSRAGPNENYARELFELHTLGAEHYLGIKRQKDVPGFDKGQPVGYVDDDVYEATRAFTGWRMNDTKEEAGMNYSGTFAAYAPWHDRFQKTVMGRYLPPDQGPLQDGKTVLEILASHPGTAKFIARKLCRRLIADVPPERVVDDAARVFLEKKDAPDQLKHVVRSILLSEEFRTTWGEKIKRPFEFFASMARALEPELRMNHEIQWFMDGLGQPLFSRRSPDGFPDDREGWSNTSLMLKRWQLGHHVSHGWIDQIKAKVLEKTPNEMRTPNQIAEYWIARTLGRAPHPVTRGEVLAALKGDGDANAPIPQDQLEWRVQNAVALLVMSPDFQWR